MLYYKKKKSKKKHYIRVSIIIFVIIISSISVNLTKIPSKIVNYFTTPFAEVTSFVNKTFSNIVDLAIGTKPNRDMVKKLTEENQILQKQVNDLSFIVNQKDYLKEAYNFFNSKKSVKANIILMNNKNYYTEFTINKGTSDGVKKGDIVVNSYMNKADNIVGALVGKVVEISANSAIVSSILDENYNISFTHSKTNTNGILNSRNDEMIKGYMLKKTNIKLGDEIYTAGLGGRFPRGIYIGKIAEVTESTDKLTQIVKVKSPINFDKLYEVFVIDGGNIQ